MTTPTTPVRRPLASLKLPRNQTPQLLVRAGAILQAMGKSAFFPSPAPPLATVAAAVEALNQAETATRTRAVGAVADRDVKRSALVVLLQQLKGYVQVVADGDPGNGQAIIESAGMSTRKKPAYPSRVFSVRSGPVSGSVKMLAPRAAKRASYDWSYSADGKKTWTLAPGTLQASTVIHGLQPGSTLVFRYRARTKAGEGDWSDPHTFVIR
jgi:hypothetical protein